MFIFEDIEKKIDIVIKSRLDIKKKKEILNQVVEKLNILSDHFNYKKNNLEYYTKLEKIKSKINSL